ncbi:cysteine desulfurase [bacterium BMS3Bbin06]|nr:cysteine desulfurase [bacterium BMS3Abin08]GBE35092.1 cysteine desulfurase [bacterium BMS3Bbin06]HDO35069.1 cysteine desulfurase [Nitrospirota bacterium]HDY71455.1 cysteine desulfurase [Nitrospirota bacterium]
MIYLDNNATTPLDEEVKSAIRRALDIFGNPSSSHIPGREAHDLIEQSRMSVAGLIGAEPDEILFTSGGTESNNLAIIGHVLTHGRGHIISSAIEHPSVGNPLRKLESLGYEVTYIKPGGNGIIEPEEIKRNLRQDTVLVTVMHANNETGTIQPIEEISSFLNERGITFHTDAAQSVGKIDVDVRNLGTDLLTIVPHKFYGPKGTGALYVRGSTVLNPVLYGAGQEHGLRPGTENIIGIAGLGRACERASQEFSTTEEHNTPRLAEILFRMLSESIPDIRLNGHNSPRLPNTLNISIKGIKGCELVESLKNSVAISSGSACHSGTSTPSKVLLSMGIRPEEALSSVRVSTGRFNTGEEIGKASGLIAEAVGKLRPGIT